MTAQQEKCVDITWYLHFSLSQPNYDPVDPCYFSNFLTLQYLAIIIKAQQPVLTVTVFRVPNMTVSSYLSFIILCPCIYVLTNFTW